MYCGIKEELPKGKVRGTQEYCIRTNQVRYYGRKHVDKKLLKSMEVTRKYNLNKERIKLNNIRSNGEKVLKEIKRARNIMDRENVTDAEYKRAKKKLAVLTIKKSQILKQFIAQEKVIAHIVAQQEIIKRNEAKSRSKTSKTKRKSKSKK